MHDSPDGTQRFYDKYSDTYKINTYYYDEACRYISVRGLNEVIGQNHKVECRWKTHQAVCGRQEVQLWSIRIQCVGACGSYHDSRLAMAIPFMPTVYTKLRSTKRTNDILPELGCVKSA